MVGRHFRNSSCPQNKTQQTPELKILNKFLFKSRKPAEFGFFGDYSSWEDAQSETGGYDQPGILAKTEAAQEVLSLPLYPEMPFTIATRVADGVNSWSSL
jgi:hypothetical protein